MILLIFMTAFFMASFAYSISFFLPNEVIYETIMTAIVLFVVMCCGSFALAIWTLKKEIAH